MNTCSGAGRQLERIARPDDDVGVLAGARASQPDRRRPTRAAGVSVTARSAASRSSPYAIAFPASWRRLRALCVSNDESTSVTPAFGSRAAILERRAKRVEARDVRQRLDHDRHLLRRELVGNPPSFGRAEQDQLQMKLVGQPHRREQIAGAIGLARRAAARRVPPGRALRDRGGRGHRRGAARCSTRPGSGKNRARPAAPRAAAASRTLAIRPPTPRPPRQAARTSPPAP